MINVYYNHGIGASNVSHLCVVNTAQKNLKGTCGFGHIYWRNP